MFVIGSCQTPLTTRPRLTGGAFYPFSPTLLFLGIALAVFSAGVFALSIVIESFQLSTFRDPCRVGPARVVLMEFRNVSFLDSLPCFFVIEKRYLFFLRAS